MILDKIVAHKKNEVKDLLARGIMPPQTEVAPPRGFRQALLDFAGVSIIAEAKKASPSKGVIQPDFDPVAIAKQYKAGGAQCMSVLTDEQFFQGSLSYLLAVREAVDLPVIRKDFLIHEEQIKEARVYGADAILLIVAILDKVQLKDYQDMAHGLGMDVLVEVHDEQEAEMALEAGTRLLGVNNRDLRDFSMDLNTTFRIKEMVPDDVPLVSESGIKGYDEIERLAEQNVAAALIGESLMRADDPVKALRAFFGE